MSIKYVFHWCATIRRLDGVQLRDGIVTTDAPIADVAALREIQNSIADGAGVRRSELVLSSLTLLHTLYPEAQEEIRP